MLFLSTDFVDWHYDVAYFDVRLSRFNYVYLCWHVSNTFALYMKFRKRGNLYLLEAVHFILFFNKSLYLLRLLLVFAQ